MAVVQGSAAFVAAAAWVVLAAAWSHMLALVLGSATLAGVIALVAFGGGAAVGLLLALRSVHLFRHPYRLHAALLTGVGIVALAMPALLRAAGLGVASQPMAAILLTTGLLAMPAALAGATLPFHRGRVGRWSYLVSAIGAVAGGTSFEMFLFPRLGLLATNILAASLNIVLVIPILLARPRTLSSDDPHAAYRQYARVFSDGKRHLAENDLENAERCFDNALTLARTLWRESPVNLLEPLSHLSTVAHTLGDKTRGLELAVEALHLAERSLGDGHPQTAIVRDNAVVCLEASGRYREIVPLLERAVGRLGNRKRFETLLKMTHAHLAYGAFHLAKQVAERALSICDADAELENVRWEALNQVGIAALWDGAPESALDAFLEAYRLSIKDAEVGAGDPVIALNVGSALRALQRYDEAAEWTNRAFSLRQGETEEFLDAVFVTARAELEESQGELQKAEGSYRSSLEAFEKHLPTFHPRVLRTRVGLARTLRARGLHEESRLLARKAVEASEGYFVASHHWIQEGTALARDE